MNRYLICSLAIFYTACALAETPVYEIHGSFGGARADAASLSADGKVVGIRRLTETGAFDRSYIVTEDGVLDIGVLSSSGETVLLAVSGNGFAAIGNSKLSQSELRPFWWSKATGIIDVGSLGGLTSYATGISSAGDVVTGNSQIAGDTTTNAFRWSIQDGISNLGTLGGSLSIAQAISADGSSIIGYSNIDSYETRAFRWRQPTGMISLGTLGGSNSMARGVSADGSVVVGASDTTDGKLHAFRWHSDTGMVDLHPQNNEHYSIADYVSGDGNVIVGTGIFDSGLNEAFRWTVENGTVSLSSLGGGMSHALAITQDGSAVVGYSYTENMQMRAFRWTANDGMIDLGTIGGENSLAWDISDDGTVIAGTAETAEGATHATLWKFPKHQIEPEPEPGTEPEPGSEQNPTEPGASPQNPEPQPEPKPESKPESKPEPEPIFKPVMIDVNQTARSVATLAASSFSSIEAQRLTLNKLQKSCDVERIGQTCYSMFADYSGFGDQKNVLTGFTLGYGFTENLSAGFTLIHSFGHYLPKGFDTGSDNFGGGMYAQWIDRTEAGEWYIRASFSANRYDTEVTRPFFAYTEAGTGESRLQGWGTALELGQTENLNFLNSRFGYYGGLRYSHVSMDGYTESNALFPFTYSDIKHELTTAYVGAHYSVPLADRLYWSANIEVEQDLAHKDPVFDARADYIGMLKFDSDFAPMRGSASTSLSYKLNNQVSIGVTPYFTRTATRENAFGASIRLSGKF